MTTLDATNRWSNFSLPRQFLIAGGIVMLVAMSIVGVWISNRIEKAVVENSASAAALYVESFISPLSQDLASSDDISLPARIALNEIFTATPLGDRVVSYKIWKGDGRVIYASDPEIIGQQFEPSDDLLGAWNGHISAGFEELDSEESQAEAEMGVPLLEVYSPIRELYTGEIIAVAEFYEHAEALAEELSDARRTAWLVVGATFLASGLLLFGIVNAGGHVIKAQGALLAQKLRESEMIAQQNAHLRARVVSASTRATAQADRTMRQLGADLHDGPAQHLALASMRLEKTLEDAGAPAAETEQLRTSLKAAMDEIRAISRGLSIPDLDRLGLRALVEKALADHVAHGHEPAELVCSGPDNPVLGYSEKLCIYRFLQEAISNASRYAGAASLTVECSVTATHVRLSVADDGPGFVPAEKMKVRADGGQGLIGLTDRAESIGGQLRVESAPGAGTKLTLELPIGQGADK